MGTFNKKQDSNINTDRTLAFLNAAFRRATAHLNKNPDLYDFQVDFAWLCHEIKLCPTYQAPVHIQAANNLIDNIIKEYKESHG